MFTFVLNYRKDNKGVYILSGSAPDYFDVRDALGDKADEYFNDTSVASVNGHFSVGLPRLGVIALDAIPNDPGPNEVFSIVQDKIREAISRLDALLGVKNILKFVDESAVV
jgi:hypothetical protein